MKIENKLDRDQVRLLLEKMIGEYVWNVVLLEDRILQAQFGQPYLRVVQVPRRRQGEDTLSNETRRLVNPTGRWTLFVEDGLWSVSADGLDCDRFAINNAKETNCLDALSGQKLISVTLSDAEAILRMKFDVDGDLILRFNVDFEQNDQWMLFCNGEGILSCDSKGEFLMDIT